MDSFVIAEKQERINTEIITTDQILGWSDEKQAKLKNDIETIYGGVFPNMGKEELSSYVGDYFIPSFRQFRRQVILFGNETGKLIAANICNFGKINHDGKAATGLYLISSAILPEYQGYGMGQIIGIKLLTGLEPDILFTTCAQSSALHSRVNLIRKGLIKNYDVYPRSEQKEGKEILVTVPFDDLDFIVSAFEQTYIGVVEGNYEHLEHAVRNFTLFMVRKNIYKGMYDFHPWNKGGKEDKLAKALGLTDKDGILVIFVKKGLL